MSLKDCCSTNETGSSVTVKVDVTKIVKYVCIAGIFIVGIIFGTKCCHKMLEEGFFDKK
ncbi:MAG: putative rane protein [Herbinix sp.]|nr:putative rane protein [Herbinix sp.]